MARIVINLQKYRGEYDFDIDTDPFTSLEWRWIKKISGYMPMTIDDGWRGGDPDLFVALAVVALARAGKVLEQDVYAAADTIARAPFDGTVIQIVGDQEDATEDPPAEPAETPDEQTKSTGSSSNGHSDSRVVDLSRTGARA